VCDLETSRIGAPYIYDISSLRVKHCNVLAMRLGIGKGFCEHWVEALTAVIGLDEGTREHSYKESCSSG
jgi:hypothetical protein